MQIMNGFRELHKYKIMHRDFKLANIFLNDDQVVIGDFGFAKSGADMATTKLGTPLTMAPELLNANHNLNYTNKADLWSIGVCFYQMLFGGPPFKVTSMNELQQKVKTQSGDNLTFDKNVVISDQCKNLLKSLMQANPNNRIEWKDFFKHPVFELQKKKAGSSGDVDDIKMHQSVMFHNNKDIVNQEFGKNQEQNIGEVELVDPLEIKLDQTPDANTKPNQQSSSDKQRELNVKRIKFRLTHEKKTIVFMMHTCRKVRNLAKNRKYLKGASDNLMYAGMLLLRKGQRLNEMAVGAVKDNKNIYNLAGFPEFTTSNDCQQILGTLTDDEKLYMTLLSHLQKKLEEEVGNNDRRTNEVLKFVSNNNITVPQLDKELSGEFY